MKVIFVILLMILIGTFILARLMWWMMEPEEISRKEPIKFTINLIKMIIGVGLLSTTLIGILMIIPLALYGHKIGLFNRNLKNDIDEKFKKSDKKNFYKENMDFSSTYIKSTIDRFIFRQYLKRLIKKSKGKNGDMSLKDLYRYIVSGDKIKQ